MRSRLAVATLVISTSMAVSSTALAQIDLLRAVPTDLAVSSVYGNRGPMAAYLVDDDLTTAWNSRRGDLVGAWIEARLPQGVQVSGIRMTVGFTHRTARADLFEGNHRIRRVRVSRDGQALGEHTLDPSSRAPQTIPVTGGGGVYRVEVLEVVAGSRRDWREVCVSDLQFLGTAPGAVPASQAPRLGVGALVPPRPGSVEPAALLREARQAVDAFQRTWARYEAAQHSPPTETYEFVPPPPVPQRGTRRRILLRVADVTEHADVRAAGALRVAALREAPWDAEGFRGTMHRDDLSLLTTAMRATLAHVADPTLTCQFTRALVDVLLARVSEPLVRGCTAYDSMSLDDPEIEQEVDRAAAECNANRRLTEVEESGGARLSRLQRITRLRFPSHLPRADWTALQAEIQREVGQCR